MFELRRTEDIFIEIMNKKGINQNILSEMSGLSRPYITGILSGSRPMSPKTIEKLCKTLEVDEEIKEMINFYELFSKAPQKTQMEIFDNFAKIGKLEAELRRYRKLEKFYTLVKDYILNDDDFTNDL